MFEADARDLPARAAPSRSGVRAIAWRSSSGQRHARRCGPPSNVGSRTLSQALDSRFCLRSSSPIALQYLVSSESGSWSRGDLSSSSLTACFCSSAGSFPSFNC